MNAAERWTMALPYQLWNLPSLDKEGWRAAPGWFETVIPPVRQERHGAVWRRLRGEHGFTLIELMITLAVVAILAAIAYPSYQDSVRKSRRADAKSVVLNAAQWMERFYTANNRYDQDRGGTAVALPAGLTQAPVEGGTKYYNISLTDCAGAATVTANTFTLCAVPIAGSAQANDRCGALTLTNTGVRGVCVAAPPTVDECWR